MKTTLIGGIRMNSIIQWKDIKSEDFLFGSQVTKKSNFQIDYENPLMSPGVPFTTWKMKKNFQKDTHTPTLPTLKVEKKYYFKANVQIDDPLGIMFKINFYDGFNEEIANKVIRGLKGSFDYPKNAETYSIEMINGGCKKFSFKWIQLTDDEENLLENDGYDVVENFVDETKILNFVFLEPEYNEINTLSATWQKQLQKIGNVATISTFRRTDKNFNNREIKNLIKSYINQFQRVNLIGIGKISNKAVKEYAREFPSVFSYIAREKSDGSANIVEYGLDIQIDENLALMVDFFDYQHVLQKLPFWEVGEKD